MPDATHEGALTVSVRRWIGLAAGIAIGALAGAGLRRYAARPLGRVPSPEGLDDAEVARAFGRIAGMPQMYLLRAYVTGRALALQCSGEAADLGCGTGRLAVELAQRAPDLRVTGVDLSNPVLAEAVRIGARADLAHRVDFRTGDAACAPFPDGTLDLVVSTLSLHHWSDPVAVLDEVARILRPGGAFVLFDLRRDMIAPGWLVVWFASRFVVPDALRRINEPLASRDAAYTPEEAARLAQASRLTGWRVARGPIWLSIEGRTLP